MTSWTYDANGNRLSQTDARGNVITYEYNAIGKRSLIRDASAKESSMSYEPGGKLAQVIDRKGQLTSKTYDALGREISVSYGATAAHPTAFRSQIEKTWDAGNRLTQIVDKACGSPLTSPNCGNVTSSAVITRVYDDLDRLTAEITSRGEVDYTYDPGGRRTSMTITNGLAGLQLVQPTISYTYDSVNRLMEISQAAGLMNGGVAQHVTFEYDAAGQRTKMTLANGITTAYGYDDLGRNTSIVYKKADGTMIGNLQYAYDAADHRVSVDGSLSHLKLPSNDVTDATYDLNNRLLTWAGHAYAYDDNGNMTSDGTNSYEWNERNKLTRIAQGATDMAMFEYDGRGRRTSRSIGSDAVGYMYDGQNTVQELDGGGAGAAVKTHLLTGRLDEVLLRTEGNDGTHQNSVLSDITSSTLMLTDASQQKIVSYSYEPYGRTEADTANDNRLQYTGRENDGIGPDGGLYYYRARYYMPASGRFISEDPVGWAAGASSTYLYGNADPVNNTDPSGMVTLGAGAGAGCLIGGLVGPEGCPVGAAVGATVVGVVTAATAIWAWCTRDVTNDDDDENDDRQGCDEEIAGARESCIELITDLFKRTISPNVRNNPKNIRKFHWEVETCVKGMVSSRCGGDVPSGAGGGSRSG